MGDINAKSVLINETSKARHCINNLSRHQFKTMLLPQTSNEYNISFTEHHHTNHPGPTRFHSI